MTNDQAIAILEKQRQIFDEREQWVAQANALAERARMDLSLGELRLLQYVLSKVKPDDGPNTDYAIDIKTFLMVCGLTTRSGYNYTAVKRQIENLWLKHFWIRDDKGRETGLQWITHPVIDRGSGKVTVRLDSSVQGYVLNLIQAGRYFQFQLLCVLPMKSEYSVKLYEYLKAGGTKKTRLIDIDTLRDVLSCRDIYPNFKDFRRRALDTACREVTEYTDIAVNYEPVFKGRRCAGVEFAIRHRRAGAVSDILESNHKLLDAQMTIEDYM